MGLDIGCRCGEIGFRAGSYSGFHWWRHELAKFLEFNLDEWWNRHGKPETPFEPLLMHSDCDGYLTIKDCKQMIEPMRELIKKLKEPNSWIQFFSDMTKEDYEYFVELCVDWLNAFEHCVNDKCRLEFG